MNKEQFIEAIKGMSVLELADLVSALEEEFGVSAVAAGPAAAAAGPAAAKRLPGSARSNISTYSSASTCTCSSAASVLRSAIPGVCPAEKGWQRMDCRLSCCDWSVCAFGNRCSVVFKHDV